MNIKSLLESLEGMQTIASIMSILKVNKKKAIYYVHRLRKKGYVKAKRRSDGMRIYQISFENRLNGTSYYEIINNNSPIKIAEPEDYRIYGKQPSIEETIVFAIKTKQLRVILAALALFRKVKDWHKLYQLAKKSHIEKQIGALYDLSRKTMRVKKMTRRFRNNALPKDNKYQYIIQNLKSDDFQRIENTWKVRIPLNRSDLEAYS